MNPLIPKIGPLIQVDPQAAHLALVRAFSKLKTREAVALHFGASVATVRRWLLQLAALQFPDPREAAIQAGAKGVRTVGRRLSSAEKAQVKKQKKDGATLVELEETWRISTGQISRIINGHRD